MKLVLSVREGSSAVQEFFDAPKTAKDLDSVITLTDKALDKALKVLARVMYGKDAYNYTEDDVFGTYLNNYRTEQESIDAVNESAMDMYNFLFDVVNELDGSEQHTELLQSAQSLIAEIKSRQSRRGLKAGRSV